MGKTLCGAYMAGTEEQIGANVTAFVPLGGAQSQFGAALTDAQAQNIWKDAATFQRLGAFNGISGDNTVCSLSINGVGGTMSVTVNGNSAQDSTHSDSANAGQSVSAKAVTGGVGFDSITSFTVSSNTTSKTGTPYATAGVASSSGGSSTITANATRFRSVAGLGAETATESFAQVPFSAGTLSSLRAFLMTFTLSANVSMVFRNGGVTKNQAITISGTGATADSTHSDTPNNGDFINYQSTNTAASGAATMSSLECWGEFGGGASVPQAGNLCTNKGAGTSGVNAFAPLSGEQNYPGVGEATAQAFAADTFKWFHMRQTIASFTSGTGVVVSRKNAADANQSITPNANGTFQDSTHTDNVTSTDKINYRINSNVTGTQLGITSDIPDPAGGPPANQYLPLIGAD